MLFISMLERGTPCPRYAFMFLVIRISSRVVHPLLLVAKVFPCSPIAPIHYRQPDSSPSVEGRPGNCMQILLTTTRSTKLPNNDPTRFLITIFLLTYTIPLRSCLSRSLRKEREEKKKKIGKDIDIYKLSSSRKLSLRQTRSFVDVYTVSVRGTIKTYNFVDFIEMM